MDKLVWNVMPWVFILGSVYAFSHAVRGINKTYQKVTPKEETVKLQQRVFKPLHPKEGGFLLEL